MCYKEPKGYYLDLDDNIYRPCYPTCKKCNELGNETNHKCFECKTNYTLIKDFNLNICYETCKYYYYFDSDNNYRWTKTDECIDEYNKLIKEKNKCIENCINDKDYKYEYNNKCYKSCPNNTHISSNDFN